MDQYSRNAPLYKGGGDQGSRNLLCTYRSRKLAPVFNGDDLKLRERFRLLIEFTPRERPEKEKAYRKRQQLALECPKNQQ